MSSPLAPDEFVEELRRVAAEGYHDKHPLHERMHAGELSDDELRRWIYNRFYYQRSIPIKDALILANLPDRAARRVWLDRIIEQDGRDGDEGGLESWLDLAVAAGLSREETIAGDDVVPAVRFAVDAYVDFCRRRTWWEGVAASLTQFHVPGLMQRRIAAIEEHYPWIDPAGLAYFHRRAELEGEHVDHAVALVVQGADTRRRQDAAIAAVRFKCDVLWALLDGLEAAAGGG